MSRTPINYTIPSVYTGKVVYNGVNTSSVLKHRIPPQKQENLRKTVLTRQMIGENHLSSVKI